MTGLGGGGRPPKRPTQLTVGEGSDMCAGSKTLHVCECLNPAHVEAPSPAVLGEAP